jgi:hypothetical protein
VERREGIPPASGVVERLWQSFADLGELERNVVDVDGAAPQEAADALASRLAERSLAI